MEPYTAFFVPLAPAGSFTDPDLPLGYAPFGMQLIGNQVFVTYAVQDTAKQNPVFGAGNGIVNIFDLEGNFVKRFATGGPLNAPWGVTQASANFGLFSNDILIGNVGDGTINAFDPITGRLAGSLKDGDGNVLVNSSLHGLTFRSDGFGDKDALYFTAGINNGQDGLFGAITIGLVSTTSVSIPPTQTDTPTPISVSVSAGPGNPGLPAGQVTILDGGVRIAVVSLIDGGIVFPQVFSKTGTHVIEARYSGDTNFLPSSSQTEVNVTGLATTVTLIAPPNADPGSPITLTATITSAGGIPTGQIVFHDGDTSLGNAALDVAGVAILRANTLSAGVHSLTASYGGDDRFSGSTSAVVALTIANPDFSLSATPPSATVIAGQATQFTLTVTPAAGFANNVTFSCAPLAGISCAFNPGTVTPTNGAAGTTLTVTTAANVSRYGLLLSHPFGPSSLIAALVLLGLLLWCGGSLRSARDSLLTATALVALVGLSLTLGGCGGYNSNMQPNRGTASIRVAAQSGAISHSTTVSVTVQ